MSVTRIEYASENIRSNRVIVYGNTTDYFILNNLKIVDFTQVLYLQLKNLGFDYVLFIDPEEGGDNVFVYERSFFDNILEYAPQEAHTQSKESRLSKLGFDLNKDGWRNSARNLNEESSSLNQISSRIVRQNRIKLNIHTPREVLSLISRTITTSLQRDESCAFVFTQFNQFLDHQHHLAQSELQFFSNQLHNLLADHVNLNISWYFVFPNFRSDEQICTYVVGRNFNPLLDLLNENQILKDSKYYVETPDKDEIRNLLNYIRLIKRIEIDFNKLDNIVFELYGRTEKLEYWLNRLKGLQEISSNELKKIDILISEKYLTPLEELNSLVGLENVKQQVKRHLDLFSSGEGSTDFSRNIIFTGNPGTGKTRVANLLANIYQKEGLLRRGKFISVTRKDLVGQYQGESAQKTRRKLEEALGGVLFIDEAYDICRDERDDFGLEVVNTLTPFMEDHRDDLLVIIAGYEDRINKFLKSNQGLESRFKYKIHFEDYDGEELLKIFKIFNNEQTPISEECNRGLQKLFRILYRQRAKGFGNARLVRNIYELASESYQSEDPKSSELQIRHLPKMYQIKINLEYGRKDLEKAFTELNKFIGLKNIKEHIHDLAEEIQNQPILEELGDSEISGYHRHLIFKGNPGTGKTEIAKILGTKILPALGVTNGTFIKAAREDMVAEFTGQTAEKTKQVFESAIGGVLFIDEVYRLHQDEHDSFGKEAIDTLVPLMEDYRDQISVIIAGYPAEVDEFLQSNPGLKDRFTEEFIFENYTAGELVEIADLIAFKSGEFKLSEKLEQHLKKFIQETIRNAKGKNFGNGRIPRKLVKLIISNHRRRIANQYKQGMDISNEELKTLTLDDAPERAKQMKVEKESDLENYDSWTELRKLKGLDHVEDKVKRLVRRRKDEIKSGTSSLSRLHMIFMGNPGTGKTTVAKYIGGILKEEGILKSGHLVAPSLYEIKGNTLGQTEKNIDNLCKQALHGLLFIDEAYALANDQFGQQAIDALLTQMENNRENLIVIIAGYPNEMQNLFKVNTGLKGRFGNNIINFWDYKPEVLLEIFLQKIEEFEYKLEDGLKEKMLEVFTKIYQRRDQHFENARMVENFFHELRDNYLERIEKEKKSDPMIKYNDIPEQYRVNDKSGRELSEALKELENLIGLRNVKDHITQIKNQIIINQERRARGLKHNPDDIAEGYVFTGNPGTGKTTVARLFGKILKTLGIISSDLVVEVGKSTLEAGYIGQTALKTREVIENNAGKVIFIDEAYRLADNFSNHSGFGKEAIGELVQLMTQPHIKGRTCFIAAGYPKPMEQFLNTNEGFSRRFPIRIHFDDFSNDELLEILKKVFLKHYMLPDETLDKALTYFESLKRDKNFGNAGEAEKLAGICLRNMDSRLMKMEREKSDQELITILPEDIP